MCGDNSFLLPSKNSSKINSEYYIATLKEEKQKAIKYYYMKMKRSKEEKKLQKLQKIN